MQRKRKIAVDGIKTIHKKPKTKEEGHDYLSSVPDEITAIILEFAVLSFDPNKFSFDSYREKYDEIASLALVSQRMRRVVEKCVWLGACKLFALSNANMHPRALYLDFGTLLRCSVPANIESMLNFEELRIDCRVFPYSIGKCTKVKRLYIQYNKLRLLPDSIGDCINLEKLHVYGNQLQSLPDSIGNCIKLKTLVLNNNQLQSLPDSIGNCIKLKRLDLDNNQLRSLPSSIGNCINLHTLYVSRNQLRSLPDSIGNCSSLKNLHLNNNQLRSLPDSIAKCSNLDTLFIHENRQLRLSGSLQKFFSKLKNIYVADTE